MEDQDLHLEDRRFLKHGSNYGEEEPAQHVEDVVHQGSLRVDLDSLEGRPEALNRLFFGEETLFLPKEPPDKEGEDYDCDDHCNR